MEVIDKHIDFAKSFIKLTTECFFQQKDVRVALESLVKLTDTIGINYINSGLDLTKLREVRTKLKNQIKEL